MPPYANHWSNTGSEWLAMRTMPNTITITTLTTILRAYKFLVSPLLGPRCRFYPSCSEYAIQALEAHGVVRGIWLAFKRVSRCHPWHPGGIDPVPHCDEPHCDEVEPGNA